ncbi:MAG TPA: RHS repeat-associated core domain-containing protein [Bacteroidia bacterium]|nr:RHS repeat-associated core domain-containing protein [Bacteroidia bacterium]
MSNDSAFDIAFTSATTSPGVFPAEEQSMRYNAFDKVTSITEGDKTLQITYGHHRQRIGQQFTAAGSTTYKVYVGACEYITKRGETTIHTYLSGPEGLFAVVVQEPKGTAYIRYIHTDHLGSWNTITDAGGNRLQEINFDAWGNRRDPNTWRAFASTPPEPLFDRGFTGHEHLYGFQLINMNGRMYDPVVSRMLSPDNFVQAPDFSQSFNRYSYAWNNPLVLTDPSGEFIFTLATLIAAPFTGGASLALLPTAIGADIGMWQGGTLANGGEMNPFKWDYSSEKTWGYMAGGAVFGGASGYVGGAIAAEGGFMANTMGLVASSYVNSVGTAMHTGGQTDVSINFGIGSFNLSTGQVRGLWNWGDLSIGEKIGYSLGALANIQDAFAGLNGGNIDVKSRKEIAGHSWIEGDDINISVGPAESVKEYLNDLPEGKINNLKWETQYLFKTVKGRNFMTPYKPEETFSTTLNNVNITKLQRMTNNLNKGLSLSGKHSLRYGVWNGCVNQSARALFRAGVFNVNAFLPITSPVLLNAELALRNYGMMFSYYMTSYR